MFVDYQERKLGTIRSKYQTYTGSARLAERQGTIIYWIEGMDR